MRQGLWHSARLCSTTIVHLQEGTWHVASRPRSVDRKRITFAGIESSCPSLAGWAADAHGEVSRRLHLERPFAVLRGVVLGGWRSAELDRPILNCPQDYRPHVSAARRTRQQLSSFHQAAAQVDGSPVSCVDALLSPSYGRGRSRGVLDLRIRDLCRRWQPRRTSA